MSKKVPTEFICPACDTTNDIDIVKPKPHQCTVASFNCNECKSRFMIKFTKVGAEHRVNQHFIKAALTEEGTRRFNEKVKANESNQKPPADEPDNQGANNANN